MCYACLAYRVLYQKCWPYKSKSNKKAKNLMHTWEICVLTHAYSCIRVQHSDVLTRGQATTGDLKNLKIFKWSKSSLN